MARAGDVIENPKLGDRIVFRTTAAESDGELLELDLFAHPGAPGPPTHVHPRADEHFEVIEGRAVVEADGRPLTLAEGQEVTVPAGTPHAFRAAGDADEEMQMRVQLRPATEMEAMLETFYGLAVDGKTNDEGMPGLLQLAVSAPEFFDTIHIAKPPLGVQKAVLGLLGPIARLRGYRARYPYPRPDRG